MGSFFTDLLSFNHNVAVLETNPERMRFIYNALRFTDYKQVEEFARMENRALPADIDYEKVPGLRTEARQKLAALRPESFGRASRISGVSPADMAALAMYIGRAGR